MQEFFEHLINGLSLGSIYALIALGYTMVYGILQLINFAHAEVYMVGAYIALHTSNRLGDLSRTPGISSFLILLGAAMVGCALLGAAIERLAYRPLRNAPKLNILITAIGVSLFLQYAGQVVFGADPKPFPNVLDNVVLFTISGLQFKSLDLLVFVVTITIMVLLNLFIYRTRPGRGMRAVSQNLKVAALMGVNPDRIITMTFMIGSALAGVASVLISVKYPKIDPLMGMLFGLKAFVAAVLGGIGSLAGAVLGGLIMGLSEEMVSGYLSSTYRDALAFGILIVILIFKPSGLLGSSKTEKV